MDSPISINIYQFQQTETMITDHPRINRAWFIVVSLNEIIILGASKEKLKSKLLIDGLMYFQDTTSTTSTSDKPSQHHSKMMFTELNTNTRSILPGVPK